MSKIITHDIYIERLKLKELKIEPLEKYSGSTTPILHRCLKHNVTWKISPNNALKGKGCSICRSEKLRTKFLKTHEQYVEELGQKNSNLEVLEEYKGAKIPILHKCKKHNFEWNISPANALKGEGCKMCGIDKIVEYNLITHEEYLQEIKNLKPHIVVLEKYIDRKTPILHHCNIHNIDYKCAPKDALNDYGCPQCSLEHFQESTRLSHEEYLSLLSIKNPNIIPLEKYVNAKTKISHYCQIHKYKWDTSPTTVLSGGGCPKCRSEKISNKLVLSKEEYLQKLKGTNKYILPVDEYMNMKTPIMHKCLVHNLAWMTSPASVIQGCGCPNCRSEKISNASLKTNEKYLTELLERNINVVPLEKYIDGKTPILHKCLKDNYIWKIAPSYMLHNIGCPKCRYSKGEKIIADWLDDNNIEYKIQYRFDDCRDKRSLPFDFYLPDYNKIIEYDGLQHFKPVEYFGGEKDFKTTKNHDNIKNDYCKAHDIPLLRISYKQNIEEELDNFLFN